jgi:hypothetical protein
VVQLLRTGVLTSFNPRELPSTNDPSPRRFRLLSSASGDALRFEFVVNDVDDSRVGGVNEFEKANLQSKAFGRDRA